MVLKIWHKNVILILFRYFLNIYSGLSSCCTARGSSSGFSRVSPTKVEACIFYTESSLVLKINNTWLIFIVTVYSYVTAYPRVSIFLSFRKYSFIMYMNFCNLWAKFVSYQNKSKFWVGLPYRRDCMIWTSYSELQMNIFKRNFNKKFTLQLKTGKRPLCLEASIWSDKFEWVPWSPIFSLCPKLYVWPEIYIVDSWNSPSAHLQFSTKI